MIGDPATALEVLRDRYLRAQLSGDRREAVRLVVEDGLGHGAGVVDLQAHVIRAAQDEIGRLWQQNRVTIAQEHMASAISQLSLAALFERATPAGRLGKALVLACVQGELHDLPARIAADFLELAEQLAAAIRDEAWPDGDAAIAVVDAACAALRYPLGTPRELQRAIPALTAAAADTLAGHRGPLDAAVRERALAELTDLATYATDAVALGQPAVFAGHTAWLAGFLERRGVPRAWLVDQLAALVAASATVVPGAAGELRRVIEPAIAMLAQRA